MTGGIGLAGIGLVAWLGFVAGSASATADSPIEDSGTKPVSQPLEPEPEAVVETVAPKPLARAFDTLPLAALAGGERVLYSETGTDRQVCTWREWGGVIDWSEITCDGEDLRVKTEFLTPVEPLD